MPGTFARVLPPSLSQRHHLLEAFWRWVARPAHHRAVRALREAAESGDLGRLSALLDVNVGLVVDSGDPVGDGVRVIRGRCDVVPALLHALGRAAGRSISECSVNGQAGLVMTENRRATAMLTIDFTGRVVSLVWVRLRPDVLKRGNRV